MMLQCGVSKMFDLNELKEAVRDTLRTYLYPQCLEGTIIMDMVDSNTVNLEYAQSFIPYNQCYTRQDPYSYNLPVDIKLVKYGNPDDGIEVQLVTDSSNTPTSNILASTTLLPSNIPTTLSVMSCTLPLTSMLGSKTRYWLRIVPLNTPSLTDYYGIGVNRDDNRYLKGTCKYKKTTSTLWTSLNKDIYFKVTTKHWIYTDYPRENLSIHNFPRCVVDFVGRPRVDERIIDHRIAYYYLTLMILVYSRYPDELDDLVSFIDQVLFDRRINITNIRILTPGNWTDVTQVRGLFTRGVTYSCRYKMVATQ